MNKIHIIPTLEDNYTYVVQTEQIVVLVDCGESGPVIDFLKLGNLVPAFLLCTHHHSDHIDGIGGLKIAFPQMKVFASGKDLFRIPQADAGLNDEEKIRLEDLDIECIETPGHTKNHLCYYMPELKAVFTGDTLFSMGCGRLFEGTPQDLFYSMQKLKALPDETLIYFGHEYTSKNLEFTTSIEPENESLKPHIKLLNNLSSHRFPSAPVVLGEEKTLNLFLKAGSVEKIAQLRQLRDKS